MARVIDIIYRYDPETAPVIPPPATAEAARQLLEAGNREFSHLLDPTPHPRQPRIIPIDLEDLGHSDEAGTAPRQEPFAVVLSCSDARVPTELIFNQGCNDLFVVRVAGNVLGSECLGSIDYAIQHFQKTLKLLVVLGHSGCGAVTAAVDAFLQPSRYLAVASSHQLRAIVDRLFVSVRTASQSLEEAWGAEVKQHARYRQIVIEMTVVLNAALTASVLRRELLREEAEQLAVVYGYYDLTRRKVILPSEALEAAAEREEVGLIAPPVGLNDFSELAGRLAHCTLVDRLLRGR